MVFMNDMWGHCGWALIANVVLVCEGVLGLIGSRWSSGEKKFQLLFSRTALISGMVALMVTIACYCVSKFYSIEENSLRICTFVIALGFVGIPLGRAQLYLQKKYSEHK